MLLTLQGCFEHSVCVQTAAARHDCVCERPYRMVDTAGQATAGAARAQVGRSKVIPRFLSRATFWQ
jgi:hypothetical protein